MNKKSGIYQIFNLNNGSSYIGSSNDINRRFRAHKTALIHQKHFNKHLQNAWNKYGSNSFEFYIIHLVDADSIRKAEQYWIDFIKPEYNIARYVDSPHKGVPCSQERKQKLREHFKDKPLNQDHCKKISDSKLGKKISKEHRINTLDKYRIPKKPVERIDQFTGEIKEYESIRAASLDGFNKSHITSSIKTGGLHKGFYWQTILDSRK